MRRRIFFVPVLLAGMVGGSAFGDAQAPTMILTELAAQPFLSQLPIEYWIADEHGLFGFECCDFPEFAARLTTEGGAPLPDRAITFSRGGVTLCVDSTNADGWAGCSGRLVDSGGFTASFAGDEPLPDAETYFGPSRDEAGTVEVNSNSECGYIFVLGDDTFLDACVY